MVTWPFNGLTLKRVQRLPPSGRNTGAPLTGSTPWALVRSRIVQPRSPLAFTLARMVSSNGPYGSQPLPRVGEHADRAVALLAHHVAGRLRHDVAHDAVARELDLLALPGAQAGLEGRRARRPDALARRRRGGRGALVELLVAGDAAVDRRLRAGTRAAAGGGRLEEPAGGEGAAEHGGERQHQGGRGGEAPRPGHRPVVAVAGGPQRPRRPAWVVQGGAQLAEQLELERADLVQRLAALRSGVRYGLGRRVVVGGAGELALGAGQPQARQRGPDAERLGRLDVGEPVELDELDHRPLARWQAHHRLVAPASRRAGPHPPFETSALGRFERAPARRPRRGGRGRDHRHVALGDHLAGDAQHPGQRAGAGRVVAADRLVDAGEGGGDQVTDLGRVAGPTRDRGDDLADVAQVELLERGRIGAQPGQQLLVGPAHRPSWGSGAALLPSPYAVPAHTPPDS